VFKRDVLDWSSARAAPWAFCGSAAWRRRWFATTIGHKSLFVGQWTQTDRNRVFQNWYLSFVKERARSLLQSIL
jgi:hypothetical protein